MKKYDNSNVFTKIFCGELPCKKVYEDEFVLAFHDINPAAAVHVLVIPKDNFISFSDFVDNGQNILQFFKSVRKVIVSLDLDDSGYRIVTNHGTGAGQQVFHFHVHILSGTLNKL